MCCDAAFIESAVQVFEDFSALFQTLSDSQSESHFSAFKFSQQKTAIWASQDVFRFNCETEKLNFIILVA